MLRAVAVPLAKPILTTLIVPQANGVWNEYIWSIMVLLRPERYPAMLAVPNFRNLIMGGYDLGAEFAAYVIAGHPLLLLFAFRSRAFIQGLTSGAPKL